MKKLKLKWFHIYIAILNIILIFMRIGIGDPTQPQSTFFAILSMAIFFLLFFQLLYLFARRNYDYFVLLWLSFYFASPIISLPFTNIGSLGLLNGVFIPLMLVSTFNLKNKYFLTILSLIIISCLTILNISTRLILSSFFEFTALLIFFYFVTRKCKNPELIIKGSLLITMINVPLGIYELIARPEWGVTSDWRSIRIMGNLFHPNSYSMYLLPSIILLYAYLRNKFSWSNLVFIIILVAMNLLAGSRMGILAMVIAIIIFEAVHKEGMRITSKKVILVMLMLIAILSYGLLEITDTHLTTGTLTERTGIWKSIIPLIKDNLILGKGLGSYDVYRSQVVNQLSPHNVYLNVIFELGLVGLILILIFIWFIIKDLARGLRKHPEGIALNAFGLSLIISTLIFALTDGAPFSQVVALNTWVLLGYCIVQNKMQQKEHQDKNKSIQGA